MLPKVVSQFFLARGITDETLKRFGIWWNGREIVIPIRDEKGKLLFNKYRRSPDSTEGPKYRNEHGAHMSLFNYDPEAPGPVIITESELDAVRLSQEGYNACSSTNGSSGFPKEWVEMLKEKPVYLCYDTDPAGVRGAIKIANMFPPGSRLYLIAFNATWKGKDVTEYLQHHTKEEFDELVGKAIILGRFDPSDLKSVSFALNEIPLIRRQCKADGISEDLVEEQCRILNDAKTNLKRKKVKKEFDESFTTVKEVPITRFVEFNGAGFANCLWHSEKSPSMKYYPGNNTVYCFGCSKAADVISVYRQLYGCTFPEALERLKELL